MIEPGTPGSAVRYASIAIHITNCATRPGLVNGQADNTADEITVKIVLSGQSKIDKTKVLKTNGSLMKV